MIARSRLEARVKAALKNAPVVALLGPRQCGKTTMARLVAPPHCTYLDLENPRDLAVLDEPLTALTPLRGLVVIDEVQRRPELFPVLRVLVDRRRTPARFLILGSASPELLRQSSETLAGRIAFVEMAGFALEEVGAAKLDRLWTRGGMPRSYLARTERASVDWRRDFVSTFVERDLRELGFQIPSAQMRRFWAMLAHYHGQIWSGAELARSLGIGESTVRRYVDILTGALVVRQLQPWHENLGKRQVKSAKVYVRDSGVLHTLLGIEDRHQLALHPKSGASWEGFALETVLRVVDPREAYFWATHEGAELDLMLTSRGERWGFEFKRVDAPRATKSMQIARSDLGLREVLVVHPGPGTHRLGDGVSAVGLSALGEALAARKLVR
ncbi:MAG: ATP-binding protein [Myxococcales bacterium]|nr:ATP-binding protein [Myxococcales bacterium]